MYRLSLRHCPATLHTSTLLAVHAHITYARYQAHTTRQVLLRLANSMQQSNAWQNCYCKYHASTACTQCNCHAASAQAVNGGGNIQR